MPRMVLNKQCAGKNAEKPYPIEYPFDMFFGPLHAQYAQHAQQGYWPQHAVLKSFAVFLSNDD
jgi:hypothetical protein